MIALLIIGYIAVGLLMCFILGQTIGFASHNKDLLAFATIFLWPVMLGAIALLALIGCCGWIAKHVSKE